MGRRVEEEAFTTLNSTPASPGRATRVCVGGYPSYSQRLKPRPTNITTRLVTAMMEYCANQVAIHFPNELDGNFLGTDGFALAMIRATAEEFIGHGCYHAQRA